MVSVEFCAYDSHAHTLWDPVSHLFGNIDIDTNYNIVNNDNDYDDILRVTSCSKFIWGVLLGLVGVCGNSVFFLCLDYFAFNEAK